MSIYAEEDTINEFMGIAHRWSGIDELVPAIVMMIENSVGEGVSSAENLMEMDAPPDSKQELYRCILRLLKQEIL